MSEVEEIARLEISCDTTFLWAEMAYASVIPLFDVLFVVICEWNEDVMTDRSMTAVSAQHVDQFPFIDPF